MDWIKPEPRQLRSAAAFALRLSTAALLALFLSHKLAVTLPLWAVLTSLVVTQISLGRSLKATLDYFVGTLTGVFWGALVALAVPHNNEFAVLLVLVLAIAPLAFIAALDARFTTGTITAAIVILVPQMLHTSPIDSAIERVVEVLLGGLTGLFISFVVMPSSAFQQTREIAAEALQRMAKAVPELIAGLEYGLDSTEAHRIQDGIGQQLMALSSAASEAERERALRIAGDPLTGPLYRTLLRMRHDLVIVGRAARAPLASSVADTLHAPLLAVGEEMKKHLEACSAALLAKEPAPSRRGLDEALTHYSHEIEALRQGGRLRELDGEAIEKLFATRFALDQMRRDLQDLDRCLNEWSARRR